MAIQGPIEMRFSIDPLFSAELGVLLCEMEMQVTQGGNCLYMPVRVGELVLRDIKPEDETRTVPYTFRVGRNRLQTLADELASVGIFPSKMPEATDAHLGDLRHSRDHLERLVNQLVCKKVLRRHE